MSAAVPGDNGRQEEYLTPDEFESRFKIRKSWLYQRIHSHTLPFPMVKFGRYCRFPLSGILEYISKQTRGAA